MSSDADELDGYDPSTPYQVPKKRKTPASRPAAGPSNAKMGRIAKSKQHKSTRQSPVVVEDDDNGDDDDDDVPEVVQAATRNDATSKALPSLVTNGKPTSKAKGKGKAGPLTNGHRNGTELVVIDELDDDDPPPAKSRTLAKKGKSPAGRTDSTEKGDYSRELEKLREERDLYKEKSEQLSESLLQLIQTRNTEPEEKLVSRKADYDVASRAQEELIQELTTQISRLAPILKEGHTSTHPFLTREAADEEKRVLEERLREVQEELRRNDDVIKDKDTRIAALNEQLETTQADLKAEIAHTQTLQNRNPKAQREPSGSAMRARTSLINDPKHGLAIRIYEDLTNLIVMNVNVQESPYARLGDFEEITYRCVFSHPNSGMTVRSLSFLLTSMYQPKPLPDSNRSPPPPKSKDDLQYMVRYTPLELDKEKQEYIQKLDFLADTFTFAFDQMDYFLKTLNDHFSSLSEEQDD